MATRQFLNITRLLGFNNSRKSGCLLLQNARTFSDTNAEKDIQKALESRFPKGTIEVRDVSGGCGAMFEVYVEAKEFIGLNTLKQHKLVTATLKDQIKGMHGVRIHTSPPSPSPNEN